MRGTAKRKENTGRYDEQKPGREAGSVEKVLNFLLRMTANRAYTHKRPGTSPVLSRVAKALATGLATFYSHVTCGAYCMKGRLHLQ